MPFTFSDISIQGPVVIEPRVFGDERGFFLESYKASEFEENGINSVFVQDNHSFSSKGVLRGLHFQIKPMAQGKLVSVITGSVWDVAVDLRTDSVTFGEAYGLVLSGENKKMFYIPQGFAHGFVTLENNTHFLYKCTADYSTDHEQGIRYDDVELKINWPLKNVLVSERDKNLTTLSDLRRKLPEWT
ncbi:MAG: dTDP-4-dehydrorhamnose 3,5-epimerase [Spirochaetales bacterium]|nr:dTDP-4-dehydrorhamnose 3,5-epimerase [Spirochaetales bacterium]